MKTYCPSCGGLIGRDCFNTEECRLITENMNRQNNELEWQEKYDYTVIPGTDHKVYDTKDPVVQRVIDLFAKRSRIGMVKYGVTMQDSPLPVLAWIQHSQEELMDAVLYLERLKQDIQK